MPGSQLSRLKNAVITVFAGFLLCGILMPLYSDEISWRAQERAGIDGVDKLMSDQCGPHTLAKPPFFIMPVRYYSAYFNTTFSEPLYVRLSGIGYALVWAAMLFALIRQICDDRNRRDMLYLIGFGLMGLGVMPLMLVLSRPEQPLMLSITAAVLLVMARRPDTIKPDSSVKAWATSLLILALAIIAMSYHLKGIVLVPAFLACLFYAGRGKNALAPRVIVAALLLAAAAVSASYWVNRLSCPGDEVVRRWHAAENMGADLGSLHGIMDWLGLIGRLIANMSIMGFVPDTGPRNLPGGPWLPVGMISQAQTFVWLLVLDIIWVTSLGVGALVMFKGLREAWNRRRASKRLVLAVMLIGTALAWSAPQVSRNFYESPFILSLTVFALLLVLAEYRGSEKLERMLPKLARILGYTTLVSMAGVAIIFGPEMVRSLGEHGGYMVRQSRHVAIHGFAEEKADILGAAAKCGITKKPHPQSLMIDGVTYFVFNRAKLPQHESTVNWVGSNSYKDPIAYLKARHSDGMIFSCRWMRPDYRARAKRQGRYCCLAPPEW